ncbi:hypothetical protein Vretimale_6696, partial [Volvox reticuliferus]
LAKPPKVLPQYATLGDALKYEGLDVFAGIILGSGLGPLLKRSNLVGTLFASTNQAWNVFFPTLISPAMSSILNITAVEALMAESLANPTFSAFLNTIVFYDHIHLGETLSSAQLSGLSSLAVGRDPKLYNTPIGSKMLIS